MEKFYTWQKLPHFGNKDYPFDRNILINIAKDRRCILALWKGLVCVTQYNEDEDTFYINFAPSEYCSMSICRERESKFDFWMDLPDEPTEYLNL